MRSEMLPQMKPQAILATPRMRKKLPAASALRPKSAVRRFWKNVK